MENHHVIIGWNERSRQLIQKIRAKGNEEPILLIDATLSSPPVNEGNFKFIRGDAYEIEVLVSANISRAKSVVVTSDPSKSEEEADQYSILLTISVKIANPTVKIITEILTNKYFENARRAGATTIIRSNEFMGNLFYNHIKHGESDKSSLEQLIAQKYKTLSLPDQLANKTFEECQEYFLSNGNVLIGLVCNGKMSINPPFKTIVNNTNLLIAL
ncbi:NAD-binding protein [Virgibacillus sp. DJP39]|uniref:NAD-binding protein n=1 Tax=Virgibacillus sp. DJP39 TaxID=3409790 RepID=UPI003BB585F7